ncbi:MAG: rhomboid family intramembrane serine protease [Bryobacteraceae bacterium]
MSTSRLCPNCRALVDARTDQCPYCAVPLGAIGFRVAQRNGFTDKLMPNGQMAVALLLLVNSALFVAINVSGSNALQQYGAKWLPAILSGDWYRLITAGYLHTQFFHILMNMMGLYNLGPIVEEIYGTRRMFALYTVATIVGFVLSSMWSPRVPSLGASAGIFGLLGALIAYGLHSKSFAAKHLQTQCLMNAGIGFIMGGFLPMIDNAAHLGGLVGGFVVAYFAGLPRWVDDAKEKAWGLIALVSLLLTLLAFFELTYRVFLRKVG